LVVRLTQAHRSKSPRDPQPSPNQLPDTPLPRRRSVHL